MQCREFTRGHRQVAFRTGAFALTELLVVIAIVSMLVAVLLPAVQDAREAARRTQCRSHLKQLALAAHLYETTHGRFPGGGWGYRWPGFHDIKTAAGQPGDWSFSLLPYLEQGALFRTGSYHDEPSVRDRALRQRLTTPVPLYNCPSRRGGELYGFDPDCETCSTPIGVVTPLDRVPRGDYAINVGDGKPDLDELAHWPLNFPGPADLDEAVQMTRQRRWPRPPSDWTGISWLRAGVRFADITDGTSSTLLFGEKYVQRGAYRSGTDWGDNEPPYGGFNNDTHRSVNAQWPLMRDRATFLSFGSFGSAHESACHFAMADGSVRSLAYAIDQRLYERLGNRRDGRVAALPD